MNLSEYALKNRTLVITALVVLIVGGFLSYGRMSKLEDPELKVKVAMVVAVRPGATSYEMELQVTDPLEKAIRSMGQVELLESASYNDLALITVQMRTTLPDSEVQQYWDLLRRKVADLGPSLPAGTSCRVMDDYGDVYGIFYAVTSDGIPFRELKDYAALVEREVLDIEGISKVTVYGLPKDCICIEFSQNRLAGLGIHPAEILLALNSQQNAVYAGYYESGEKRMRIGVGDGFTSLDEIRNTVIPGHEKDRIRLGDIATVERGYETPVRTRMRFDGQEAIGLAISAESGTDITKLGDRVRETIARLQKESIPAGVDFHPVFFQPDIVRDSIRTFLLNLAESVLIVILILMATMGWRSGVIIAVSLIGIVFGSFFVLDLFDGTLQRVSLGSFILAMGMLVDNAIVIVDGILVDLRRGIPRQQALTAIGGKTAMPLLGATVIAILAFFPIALSPDMAGTYVRDLFIVLAVSLLLSWVLALTQVPIHCSYSLRNVSAKAEQDPYGSRHYRRLRRCLEFVVRHRIWTVGAALLLVGASAWCYRYVPQMFFPDMSYDQLYIEYKMPEGTTPERVDSDLRRMEAFLLEQENVLHVTSSLGGTPARYCLVRAIAEPSLSYGELIVQYRDKRKMNESIPELQQTLTAAFPEAYVRVKQYNLMYRKYPIEAVFSGPDPAVLKELAAQAAAVMEKSTATCLVTTDWSEPAPMLEVGFDRNAARETGISRTGAGISLLAANGGVPCGTFTENGDRQTIYLKTLDEDGKPVESLENVPVWGFNLNGLAAEADLSAIRRIATGSLTRSDLIETVLTPVPLSQVSEGISIEWEEPVIRRSNGQRTIKVQANNATGYTAAEAREAILHQIEAIPLPPGYRLDWLGEYEASRSSTRYLFANVPLAIVLMLLIMIALFRDLKKPAVIVCCLPLIAVGVVFGILASGKDFGFVAIVGTLGIIGMMIKNGIVLIDEIDRQIASGRPAYTALIEATLSRFRPVMMASLTTVVGMVPLLWDPLFGSLAVTIMSGLAVGTVITLLFLPALYSLFFHIVPEPAAAAAAAIRHSDYENENE